MSAKELIKAAEITDAFDTEFDEGLTRIAARKIALHILSTVREDDDEPITDDWLFVIGFKSHRVGELSKNICQNTSITTSYDNTKWFIESKSRSIEYTSCVYIGNLKTRGQIRKLLEVLGGGK